MFGNPTFRHSPEYKDFLFDGTITLCIGRDKKRMEIHKKLLTSISPELDKHVNNDMKEGIEGVIHLPDEGEEAIALFTKWAYTGDYTAWDSALFGIAQHQWPSLHKHLQLCAFSDKFNIPVLKQLAELKFYTQIITLEPKSKEDGAGLILAISYAHNNLRSSDPVLKFLTQYASWKFELLRETPGFRELIMAQPEFLTELLATLKGSSTKPIAPEPQKRPKKKNNSNIFGTGQPPKPQPPPPLFGSWPSQF
ncbi:unnamed protein product [Tuber aestivum]|uniref:BTB domain-containing protein n=1 Tax=Tuber aestivum TaxID=59557 RepID=A0A292Q199_9PEZI|nr:unnamed protein product [Tuber aestivum]